MKWIAAPIALLLTICLASAIIFGAQDSNAAKMLTYGPSVTNFTSNIFTQPEKDSATAISDRFDLSDYTLAMEDDSLRVYIDERNAELVVQDKQSGYIWGCLAEDVNDSLNTSSYNMAKSFFTFEYVNLVNNEKRASLSDNGCKLSYEYAGNRVNVSFAFSKLKISGKMYIELTDGVLAAGFDYADFAEEGENLVTSVYVLPFFGSTFGNEMEGYFLIPDGPGALMRFREPTHYIAPYTAKVYGKDYGLDAITEFDDSNTRRPTDYRVEEKAALIPLFGVSHANANAFYATMTQGAEWATLLAYPAGTTYDYNWITARYGLRQVYLQPVDRTGGGVMSSRHPMQPIVARTEFRFLTGDSANYAGMANSYRDNLRERGMLPKGERIDGDIPLRAEIVASDVKSGFLVDSVMDVTTNEQANNIIETLRNMGISNVTAVVSGWQNGGLNGASLSAYNPKDSGGLQSLRDNLSQNGGRLYLQDKSMSGTDRQLSPSRSASFNMSQSYIKTTLSDFTIKKPDTYYLKPELAARNLASKLNAYSKNSFTNLALSDYMTLLYANNHNSNRMSRLEAFDILSNALNNDSFTFAAYAPYEKMWQYSGEIFDIPVINSRYTYATDTVPFLQMLLKGSADLYGRYVNESFYTDTDILRMIEYGTYPSFLLTGVSNDKLIDTRLKTLYSTYYSDWLDTIDYVYEYVNGALKHVEGAQMINHTALKPGVSATQYSNGVTIYVNYTHETYWGDDFAIMPNSYKVAGGDVSE